MSGSKTQKTQNESRVVQNVASAWAAFLPCLVTKAFRINGRTEDKKWKTFGS